MARRTNPDWPVLTSYDEDHLPRIALPLGGIGTGTISLGGRGDLRDWELVNRPAKGFAPAKALFALHARPRGDEPRARLLEGPFDGALDTSHGQRATTAGMPRFRRCAFHAAYPLGQVVLSDRTMPLEVRLEAFNPLIPPDPDDSGLPVAVLRYVLRNPTDAPVSAAVAGNFANFIGTDGTDGAPSANANAYRDGERVRGIRMSSAGVAPDAAQFGTMALATTARRGVTWRTDWEGGGWADPLREFWDDFRTDGRLSERGPSGRDAPMGSLAVRTTVPAGGERAVTFLIAWRFPNRPAWDAKPSEGLAPDQRVGNHYAARFADAWDAAEHAAGRLNRLERDTVAFVRAMADSDAPAALREAALYNLNALRSQTAFRIESGELMGWEGCGDRAGCCPGSCTHVWNYEPATAHLFGGLARSMRRVELEHGTRAGGQMSFRIRLPLAERGCEHSATAADGQMGAVIKLYREWRLSGDDDWLRALWPKAREALAFAWIEGGWDADRDGVMEGCQHNTSDLEIYGPNPLLAGWYLGALRAAEEMATHLGEDDFAAECRRLFDSGSRWVDENLFNGSYYEHELSLPEKVADGLALHGRGHTAADGAAPPQQPLDGCMTDQLVGQYLSRLAGLGDLLGRRKMRTAMRSVMKHNFLTDLYSHANPVRAFAVNHERVLVFGTYPNGQPERPCFRFFENWTGIEYAAAALMIELGRVNDALKVIEAVRERFDGRKRNPFDEPECGHHYARSMASFGAYLAWTGQRYSAVTKRLAFSPSDGKAQWLFATGEAWGTCAQRPRKRDVELTLRLGKGRLPLATVGLHGVGAAALARPRDLKAGDELTVRVPRAG